jgi:two-component system nitrogen regulation response regulator GlnG
MMKPADIDLTLPAVVASLRGNLDAMDLVLTVIFHPDTSRIGHRAVVPKKTGTVPWVLGRRSPDFKGPDEQSPFPLDDPHISRRALQFIYQDRQLTIRRFDSSSRCRVGPKELYESVEMDWDQLREGVPLMLGHSIVLMLRLARRRTAQVRTPGCADLLLGSSACMERVREQVTRAADSDLDVLIRGETGTGKDLVATAIHRVSARAEAPMVSVNMAAIPCELAAAALFGSARGAYTGAESATAGYFEQAQGGNLFLDEIGETSLEVQPQLLRALQQREIQQVGGATRRVDVRVISATDAILDGEDCDFKAALRHRLGAYEIVLPPLRKHPEDIGELLLHYLQKSADEAGRDNVLPHTGSPALDIAAWALLFFRFASYRWPGNVRELANFAQQVVLTSDQAPMLNENLQAALASTAENTSCARSGEPRRKIQDIDDATFEQAMVANDFEVQRVAAQLGVSRGAVYRRIEVSPGYRLATEISADELQRALAEHDGDSASVARHLQVSLNSLRVRLRNLSSGCR